MSDLLFRGRGRFFGVCSDGGRQPVCMSYDVGLDGGDLLMSFRTNLFDVNIINT